MVVFFYFSLTSSHLHPLQAENCDSNSRLVVDEDDNDKLRFERVNPFSVETVFICQNLTAKDCPCTEKIKMFLMAVHT